jgi:hypothetical protein
MVENGLKEYLILLSIRQTCDYKGVSFYHFLLSRKRDIDLFCSNSRIRAINNKVEIYPKGFTPPYIKAFKKNKEQR